MGDVPYFAQEYRRSPEGRHIHDARRRIEWRPWVLAALFALSVYGGFAL